MASSPKVLIVEDDPHIRLGLEEILKSEDFQPVICEQGNQALSLVEKHRPRLILLDVMLPGKNGFEICKEIRAKRIKTPILMLTAKGQELDKVIGLDLGADDYVTKPFGVKELIARIHALLRRTHPFSSNSEDLFELGACTIDPKTFQIRRGKKSEDLTPRELQLLQFFHQHPNEVLSRDRILTEIWGYEYFGTTRTLDQTIVQLRKKLGDHGSHPEILVTVHGVGYKLVVKN